MRNIFIDLNYWLLLKISKTGQNTGDRLLEGLSLSLWSSLGENFRHDFDLLLFLLFIHFLLCVLELLQQQSVAFILGFHFLLQASDGVFHFFVE